MESKAEKRAKNLAYLVDYLRMDAARVWLIRTRYTKDTNGNYYPWHRAVVAWKTASYQTCDLTDITHVLALAGFGRMSRANGDIRLDDNSTFVYGQLRRLKDGEVS